MSPRRTPTTNAVAARPHCRPCDVRPVPTVRMRGTRAMGRDWPGIGLLSFELSVRWTEALDAYALAMAASRSRKARGARRRQRRMDRVEHDLSSEQWVALQEAWGGCAYCGAVDRPLQRDCVLALSRGGRYTLNNIAPACGACNASKCNDEVTGWLRRKRLDERAFLLRQHQINATLAKRFTAEPETQPEQPEALDS